MTSRPRVTVITPSFNQARFLERAICSVLDQGYADLEYIVVDGGSCDGSTDIIQRYEDDLAWWISANDGGPAEALNRALNYASGDIVGILNSDDVYLPMALEQVAARMTQSDSPAWVVGHVIDVDEHDEPVDHPVPREPFNLDDFLASRGKLLPPAGSFMRGCVFESFGNFETMLHHRFHFEYACRLLSAGVQPTLLPEYVASHRIHAASMGRHDPHTARREGKQIARLYTQRLAKRRKAA